MTEIEMMLQDEIKEKKELARNAQRKPRRTRYHMDSDKLTEAQRQALNGPVVSYNLNAPMVWTEFKRLPETSQRLYLSSLIERYGARDTMLAKMFGTTHSTVTTHRNKLGIKAFAKGGNPRPDLWLRWNEFLGQTEADAPVIPEPEVTPEPVVIPETQAKREPAATTIARLEAEKEAMKAEQMERLRKAAETSWDNLFTMAKRLGEQYGLHVRIEVTT